MTLVRGVVANLVAGTRVALFLPVDRSRFRLDPVQLVAFLVVSALVDNATDWIRHGPDVVLDWSAAGGELASFAVLVAAAALLAWWFAVTDLVIALPVIVLASMPLVQFANLVPQFLVDYEILPPWMPEAAYYVVLAWFLAVLWRSAFVALADGRLRAARSVVAAAVLAAPLFIPEGVLPQASWWAPRDNAVALATSNPAAEPVLALQRELQDEALDALAEHTPGETDLYFVGFAGDGDALTWRPRLEHAQRSLDAHWGTSGRSLVYVNDPAALTQSPAATITHLREAFDAIAGLIDPDEDILLMYIGGRSNADGSLTVSLPPLGLVQLTGSGLSHLMVQAGIRYGIIVLSSCASRAFVDAVAHESNVVLAVDDESCDLRRARLVGDLLFNETLPGATSLRAALESAQRIAGKRGTKLRLHVGESVAPLLARVRVPAANRTSLQLPMGG